MTFRRFASALSAAASSPKTIWRHGRAWTMSCSPLSVTSTLKKRVPPRSATGARTAYRRRRRDADARDARLRRHRHDDGIARKLVGMAASRKLPTIVQKPLAPSLGGVRRRSSRAAAPPACPSWCMRTRGF